MKYWGVALAFAAFISVNAEANILSLFHQLLKSVQNTTALKMSRLSDSGGGDPAGGNTDGSNNQRWVQ